jgi:hypothetical protein
LAFGFRVWRPGFSQYDFELDGSECIKWFEFGVDG